MNRIFLGVIGHETTLTSAHPYHHQIIAIIIIVSSSRSGNVPTSLGAMGPGPGEMEDLCSSPFQKRAAHVTSPLPFAYYNKLGLILCPYWKVLPFIYLWP